MLSDHQSLRMKQELVIQMESPAAKEEVLGLG